MTKPHTTPKRGPGRPPSGQERLRAVSVTLPAAQVDAMRTLGAGSISAGIRVCVAAWMKKARKV